MPLLSADTLRETMRHVPSAVTVVTAGTEEKYRGVTIGSFTSLSLNPPLISFNIGRQSRIHPLLESGPKFAVHVLSASQSDLSRRFARSGLTQEEQFAGISHSVSPDGPPLLDDTALILCCEPERMIHVGDKSIVVGHVLWTTVADTPSSLLHLQSEYRGIRTTSESGDGSSPRLSDISASLSLPFQEMF